MLSGRGFSDRTPGDRVRDDAAPPVRDDTGFTLVELIVTIAIVGFVVAALVGVVFQYFRVTGSTTTRMNESTDQQFVSAYWQQDVSSLGYRDFTAGATDPTPTRKSVWTTTAPTTVPSGCRGLAGLVIGFAWSDYAGNSDPLATWTDVTSHAAVYVATKVGTAQWQLSRVRCSGSSTRRVVVARRLTGPPQVQCLDARGNGIGGCDAGVVPDTVSITLDVRDDGTATHESTGYTTTLTAERRQG